MTMDAKQLVSLVTKNLVEQPDKVEISASEGPDGLSLILHVAEEDKGKVIGKQGKVIKALRTVVSAAAAKAGQKVAVDLE